MTLNDNPFSLAIAYINHLTNERRLSLLTCKSYSRDIAVLLKFTKERRLTNYKITTFVVLLVKFIARDFLAEA